MTNTTRTEQAEMIAAALTAAGRGWTARAWEGDGPAESRQVRVYVSEGLARRTKECGYIEILADGALNLNPITNGPKAAMRELAKRAIG